jgi:two-component system sensor histidine kinase GlrK
VRTVYPKTFFSFLLLAFVLAVLPLLAVLVEAMGGVDRFASRSRTALGETTRAARASRQLLDETTGLERLARQMLILRDPAVLADYGTLRTGFRATGSELSLLPLDEAQLDRLNRLIDTEQALFERLAADPPGDAAELADGYAGQTLLAREMLDVGTALLDREMALLEESADAAQRRLWAVLPLMLLLGGSLVLTASWLIARPVRALDAAIGRLGEGDLSAPIVIAGPADLARLGERLDWLRRRLAELEAEKARFLRHVSHELKTPLTALREGASLLADGAAGPLREEQAEIVAILQHKSLQLQGMIERLLAVQREIGGDAPGEGPARLQRVLLRLDTLIEEVVAEHRLTAGARGVGVNLRLRTLRVHGDPDKLSTLIDNLLSNAIRHSPAGAMIDISLRREGDMACVEVADQGPGIAAADRENIFDWFYHGATPPGAQVAGSGFGLAIAREFALAHHGTLELMPDRGPGATFRLTLPLPGRKTG